MNHRVIKIILLLLVTTTGMSGYAVERLAVPNGELFIEWQSEFSVAEQKKLRSWLTSAANTTSLMGGSFPRSQAKVIIKRYDRSNSSVPWAHTIRNGPVQGVEFYVNTEKSLEKFVGDWTAVHEFSHLFIPYPGKKDIWISEGFASYFQNILMAKAGILTEQQAWQKLADGFGRGSKDNNRELSLAELSPKMRAKGAFMRVYWTGALYFLEADIALRKQNLSLDAIVSEYANCCRDQYRYWNGIKLAKAFDSINNTQIFVPLFKEYEREHALRDYKQVMAQLGIQLVNETVKFSSDRRLQTIREKITQ